MGCHFKIFITLTIALLCSLDSLAQWDTYYYDEYVPQCQHQGTLYAWEVVRYRSGLSRFDKWEGARGKLRFSHSCFEIVDCNQIEICFCIQYDHPDDSIWKLMRCDYDDNFDYVEIKPALGFPKGLYSVFIGHLDESGNLQNTVQIICRPLKISYPKDPQKNNKNGVIR